MFPYARQVNCLTHPERDIVEAFRVLVFGVLVNPMPGDIYEAFWASATWGTTQRREVFEEAFAITMVTIDEIAFAVTLLPLWFVNYNEAVEAGDVSITVPCPCNAF